MNTEIKQAVIDNETRLLANFPEYSQSIKQYILKLNAISHDADFYNFIIASFKNKKEQEFAYNRKGFVSSKQLINNLTEQLNMDDSLTPEILIEGKTYSHVDISCLANNYNFQVGMYYLEKERAVVIKTTIEDEKRPFNDRWLDENDKSLIYCMQKESDEAKKTCHFSHRPNAEIYQSMMNGESMNVYVFMNHKKGEPFVYAGIYHAKELTDDNVAFVMYKEGFRSSTVEDEKVNSGINKDDEVVINVTTLKKKKGWLYQEEMASDSAKADNKSIPMVLPELPPITLKVGKFIYTAMENLENSGYIFTESLLESMCDRKWSRDVLKTDYPFLVKYDGDSSVIYDKKGRIRYKKQLFTFNGNKYYVTKELWELPKKNNKTAFINWYLSIAKEGD